MKSRFLEPIRAWLERRERALDEELEALRSERDSLFQAFEVARSDVAFERSDSVPAAPGCTGLNDLDRASQGVRRRINRTERQMQTVRRRAQRYRNLARRLE